MRKSSLHHGGSRNLARLSICELAQSLRVTQLSSGPPTTLQLPGISPVNRCGIHRKGRSFGLSKGFQTGIMYKEGFDLRSGKGKRRPKLSIQDLHTFPQFRTHNISPHSCSSNHGLVFHADTRQLDEKYPVLSLLLAFNGHQPDIPHLAGPGLLVHVPFR